MLRDIISNDLFTILIVIGFILIAIAKVLFAKRFQDFIYVLGNSKYLKIYAREQRFFDAFDALLFTNFVLSVVIIGIISFNLFLGVMILSYSLIFKLVFAVATFIVMKILIERLIGSLFDIDFLIDNYLFQKISYMNFIGLLLMPLNALLIYSFNPSTVFMYCVLCIVFVVFLIGLITSIKTYQNLIKQNLFYFILYLCALEIAPYVVLYTFLKDL